MWIGCFLFLWPTTFLLLLNATGEGRHGKLIPIGFSIISTTKFQHKVSCGSVFAFLPLVQELTENFCNRREELELSSGPPLCYPNLFQTNGIMLPMIDIINPVFWMIVRWHWIHIFECFPWAIDIPVGVIVTWWMSLWVLMNFVMKQSSLRQWMRKSFPSILSFNVASYPSDLSFIYSSIWFPGTWLGQTLPNLLINAWMNNPTTCNTSIPVATQNLLSIVTIYSCHESVLPFWALDLRSLCSSQAQTEA